MEYNEGAAQSSGFIGDLKLQPGCNLYGITKGVYRLKHQPDREDR